MSHPPDPRAIGTDPDALEAFYREHVGAIQRFVARRVGDPERAADLTADVLLAAVENATDYAPSRGPQIAWLFGIARNVVAADTRSRAREERAVRRLGGRRALQPDALARAQERIDAERESRRLYAAVGQLPEGQRAVFELVALDGLSVAEAATALGVQPVTARVRLHRARRFMQSHLAQAGSVVIEPTASAQEALT